MTVKLVVDLERVVGVVGRSAVGAVVDGGRKKSIGSEEPDA